MRITFDPSKSQRNALERGLPFEMVADLQWETALVQVDDRRDYGEKRLQVLGFIGVRLHMAVVTFRRDAVHVISLRKANEKEVARHGKKG